MVIGRSFETKMEIWPSQDSTQAAAFTPLALFLAKIFFKVCCETLSGLDKSMTVTEAGFLKQTFNVSQLPQNIWLLGIKPSSFRL